MLFFSELSPILSTPIWALRDRIKAKFDVNTFSVDSRVNGGTVKSLVRFKSDKTAPSSLQKDLQVRFPAGEGCPCWMVAMGQRSSEERVWASSLNQCWQAAEMPKKRQQLGSWLGGPSEVNSKCPDSTVKAIRWRRQRLQDAFQKSESTVGWRIFSSFGKILLASSCVSIYLYLCHGLDDLKALIQPKWFYIYAAECSEALTDPAHTPHWLAKSHLSLMPNLSVALVGNFSEHICSVGHMGQYGDFPNVRHLMCDLYRSSPG